MLLTINSYTGTDIQQANTEVEPSAAPGMGGCRHQRRRSPRQVGVAAALRQMGMETVDELDLAIVIADLTDGGADDDSADVDDDVREASVCCGAVLLLVAPCSQSCRYASQRVLCVRMSRLRLRHSRGGSYDIRWTIGCVAATVAQMWPHHASRHATGCHTAVPIFLRGLRRRQDGVDRRSVAAGSKLPQCF